VQSFHPENPTCGTGPTTVFVTSQTFAGDLGGIVGADQICNNLAQNAGLPGTYIAWLSTSTVNARDRLNSNGPYRLVIGTIIADDLQDLLDGFLDAPINIDENGTLILGNQEVWTGTLADGSAALGRCSDWTANSNSVFGTAGNATSTAQSWTVFVNLNCSMFNRLYCFQQ